MNVTSRMYESVKNSNYTPDPRPHVSPSCITDCARKLFYKRTGHPESDPTDNPARLKMEVGTLLHEHFLKKLPLKEMEASREKVIDGVLWTYRIDGILEDGTIIEIKTVYGAGADRVKDAPDEKHLLQTQLYMYLEGVSIGKIVYICRDSMYIFEHDIGLPATFKQHFSQINDRAKKIISAGECPDREYRISLKNDNGNELKQNFQREGQRYQSAWQCRYCQYNSLCWKDIYAEARNHKFFIDGKFID